MCPLLLLLFLRWGETMSHGTGPLTGPLFIPQMIYSAFADKVERNCHFPAPSWNCTTHRQALQSSPDTSQVSLRKNNKINLPFVAVPAGSRGKWRVQLYQWTQMEQRWNDTGEPRRTREKNLSQRHFFHKFHMDWREGKPMSSAVRSRRLTAWAMARPSVP
jgi:hypothetical protein